MRRGQGPVSARRGGGGVAEVGCESVSAPSEGAARGGGGVRRRGRAVAGRGRGRAAQTQYEMSSASALYHAERALRSPEDAGALTRRLARAQRLQGWVWKAEKDWQTLGRRARSPAGVRIRGLDNAGQGTAPEFSMLDNLGECDIYLSITQFRICSPKLTLILKTQTLPRP